MRKLNQLSEVSLAFAGGSSLNDEVTSIQIALRQIEREEKGLPPVME